jgi:hypothetical protein
MKLLVLFVVVTIAAISCKAPERLTSVMDSSRLRSLSSVDPINNFAVSIDQDSIPNLKAKSSTKKNKDMVIVLPFISWHRRNYDCTVGRTSFSGRLRPNIEKLILESLKSTELSNKYELKLKVAAAVFTYTYTKKGGIFVPIVATMTWNDEHAINTRMLFKLEYSLLKNGEVVETGEVEKKQEIGEITEYKPGPYRPYDPGPDDPMRGSKMMNATAHDNLKGSIYQVIRKEMKIGLATYNELVNEVVNDLMTKKLAKYLN